MILDSFHPDIDALISYTNINGTFGPYLSGGIDPQSFKKDAWGNNLIYNYTTDTFGRRESATIKSLGADNAIGGTGTAEDIQISIDSNEVFSASSASCNVLVRYATAPTLTFSANITVHIVYKDGEGLEIDNHLCHLYNNDIVEVTFRNNYTFGSANLVLTPEIACWHGKSLGCINKNSSGNLLPHLLPRPLRILLSMIGYLLVYANNLSISVP